MTTTFLLMVLGCLYSYFVYPAIMKLIPPRSQRITTELREEQLPELTIIITVHNEELRIANKISRTLALDYPEDLLRVIVASDCSSDRTDSIVQSYPDDRVTLVRATERRGKEYAQLCAIRKCCTDILVFSDVATEIGESSLRTLASQFTNPEVGAVSSEDRLISKAGKVGGEGAYVKYEMYLRQLESDRAGLIGLSGSFFAARRQVCSEWDVAAPSDFGVALCCRRRGMYAVSHANIIGYYQDLKDPRREYQRKKRTVIRGMQALYSNRDALNIFKFGLFSFQVWSHKVMRWAVPWFLLGLAIITVLIWQRHWVFTFALIVQCLFYLIAALGTAVRGLHRLTFVRIVTFFVHTNVAIAMAALSYAIGKRIVTWAPSTR